MSYTEKITANGRNIVVERPVSPVQVDAIDGAGLKLEKINVFDPGLLPPNYASAEGSPMTIFQADGLKVDLSKRTKAAMGFWHRNCDYDELIFCVKGSIHWETELGEVTLKAGEMFHIPRGIAHRSAPGQTDSENVVLELKVRNELKRVGG
jgi:mannose-6-phosphate isomerase-like protein (cupin superfamily)